MTVKPQRVLGVLSLSMITITSVDSIRNIATTALFGSSVIFFFILGALCFFIPVALVCAELSSTYRDEGGVYLWGKKAINSDFGLLLVWFQWVENVVYYPVLLSFIGGTAAYIFNPELASNKFFMFGLINVLFWLFTFLNMFGMRASSKITDILGITGLVIPMIFISILGVIWYFSDNPNHITFTTQNLMPSWDATLWVSLSAVIMSLTGVEITTVYVNEARDPQKNYPRALLISTIFIVLSLMGGALAIALIIPTNKLNLISGIMEQFSYFFTVYKMTWAIPLLGGCIVLGALATLNNWIISPAKGLLVAAKDGYLPKSLQKLNSNYAPVGILIAQGVFVTILSFMFLWMPSISSSYWLLGILMTQLYMFMYIGLFISFVRLRYKDKTIDRPFKVPGGKLGMWVLALLGIATCLFTMGIGFIPPKSIGVTDYYEYALTAATGLFIFSAPAVLLPVYKRLEWRRKKRIK